MDKRNRISMVFNMGHGHMVQIIKYIIYIVSLFSNMTVLGNTVLEKYMVQNKTDISDIDSVEIFIAQNNPFVLLNSRSGKDFISSADEFCKMQSDYGIKLNGFIQNGKLIFAFMKNTNILFYDITDKLTLNNYLTIVDDRQKYYIAKVIAVPECVNKYYFLCERVNFQPLKTLKHILSGGHAGGNIYTDLYIGTAENNRISKYSQIDIKHDNNVTYKVVSTVNDAKMLHLLGFKQSASPSSGMPVINSEIILCHVGFNLETMKVNQCHDIFKMTYDPGSYDIGTQSISCKNQNVFVVFSRKEYAFRGAPRGNIQEIKSDIYYFQYFNDRTSDAVKIGKGFLPQVRFDSNGEVYVFYIDYSGNLVVKKKENDCWSDNQIILSQIDLLPEITFMKCLDVKFDNENNLHIVYPSKGSLIYEKRKLLEN